MKKQLTILLFLVFTTNWGIAQETAELDEFVTIINNSLVQADKDLKSMKIEISSAKIKLKTSYSASGGGGFKIFVKGRKKWSAENSNTMTFEYAKFSAAKEKSNIGFIDTPLLEENLKSAIINAASQWHSTSNSIMGLSKKSFTVEIAFIVKDFSSTGIEFEIIGVGIDLGGDIETSAVHIIELTFK